MTCEQYQSLPADERSPEDRLAIELARVLYFHICFRGAELTPLCLRPNNGAGALDVTLLSS